MLPQYSNQAAEAILRVQGEPVLINGVTTTAVVVRYKRSDNFGAVAKYKLSPSMALLKVSGLADTFSNALIVFDGREWRVSSSEIATFGLCELTVRLQPL